MLDASLNKTGFKLSVSMNRLSIHLAWLILFTPMLSQAQLTEYDVKAALLGRMIQYVEWPAPDSANFEPETLIISVLGKNPFENSLHAISPTNNKRFIAYDFTIRYITELDEIPGSHILFITGTEAERLPEILKYVEYKPILTVGDTENFALQGVHINFYLSENKTRFELNEASAHATGFVIDFRLRSVAKIVSTWGM